MERTYSPDGCNKECIQNFGVKTSLKGTTWKTNKGMRDYISNVSYRSRLLILNWIKLSQVSINWW
jgi:hypothetical protein